MKKFVLQNILPPMPEALVRHGDLPGRTVWIDGKRYGASRVETTRYPKSKKLDNLGLSETPIKVVVIGVDFKKVCPVNDGNVWVAHGTSVKQIQAEAPVNEGLDNFTKLPAPEISREDPSNNLFYDGHFATQMPNINDALPGVDGSDRITFTTELPKKPFVDCITSGGKPTRFEILQSTIFTDPENNTRKTLLINPQKEILQIESSLLSKL